MNILAYFQNNFESLALKCHQVNENNIFKCCVAFFQRNGFCHNISILVLGTEISGEIVKRPQKWLFVRVTKLANESTKEGEIVH